MIGIKTVKMIVDEEGEAGIFDYCGDEKDISFYITRKDLNAIFDGFLPENVTEVDVQFSFRG
jgi:hypothetical protein